MTTTEEIIHALTISVGELTARLNGALFALHTIAGQDYRGPRPESALIAERALARHGVCDCHTRPQPPPLAHGRIGPRVPWLPHGEEPHANESGDAS